MYVYLYIYIYIYIHTHTHVCTRIHVYNYLTTQIAYAENIPAYIAYTRIHLLYYIDEVRGNHSGVHSSSGNDLECIPDHANEGDAWFDCGQITIGGASCSWFELPHFCLLPAVNLCVCVCVCVCMCVCVCIYIYIYIYIYVNIMYLAAACHGMLPPQLAAMRYHKIMHVYLCDNKRIWIWICTCVIYIYIYIYIYI